VAPALPECYADASEHGDDERLVTDAHFSHDRDTAKQAFDEAELDLARALRAGEDALHRIEYARAAYESARAVLAHLEDSPPTQ